MVNFCGWSRVVGADNVSFLKPVRMEASTSTSSEGMCDDVGMHVMYVESLGAVHVLVRKDGCFIEKLMLASLFGLTR